MASVLISAALKAVPWKMLISQAPVIIDGANTLISKIGEMRQGARQGQAELTARLQDIEDRLNALETHQTAQAELFKEIATQLNGLTESVRIVAARTWVAVVVSAFSVVFALGVGLWAFLHN